MQSFAFWYTEKDLDSTHTKNSDIVAATLNFNLWYECGWKTKRNNIQPILDIGFKIENLTLAKELSFFIPFSISEEEKKNSITDLGCKFHSTELVDALFNESFKTTISANSKIITVEKIIESSDRDSEKKDIFKIYQLDIEHDMTLVPFSGGTIIRIPTDNITTSRGENNDASDIDTYYLRFRICHTSLQAMIHQYEPPHGKSFGAFEATNMVDFRYNNVRSLDRTLIEQFYRKGNKRIQVRSVHFLLMTKAYIDVESRTISSVRKLETNVWSDYISNGEKWDMEDIVAYHHSIKPKSSGDFLTSAEIFLKIKKAKTKLGYYAVAAVIISIMSGVASELLRTPVEVIKNWIFFCLHLIK